MINPVQAIHFCLLTISFVFPLMAYETDEDPVLLEDGCYKTLRLAFNDVALVRDDRVYFDDKCYHEVQCFFPRAGKLISKNNTYTCLFEPVANEEMR